MQFDSTIDVQVIYAIQRLTVFKFSNFSLISKNLQ